MIRQSFQDYTVVNRACHSINGGSLSISQKENLEKFIICYKKLEIDLGAYFFRQLSDLGVKVAVWDINGQTANLAVK